MSAFPTVVFGVVAGVLALATDFYMYSLGAVAAEANGRPYTDSYVESLVKRMTEMVTPEPDLDLAVYLPAPPEGWTRRPYDKADVLALTGTTRAEDGQILGADIDTKDMVRRFDRKHKEVQRLTETYVKGDWLTILRIDYDQIKEGAGLIGDMKGDLRRSLASASLTIFGQLGAVKGVTIELRGQGLPVEGTDRPSYLNLSARLGAEVQIRVLTNAPLDEVKPLVEGLDIVGLNALQSLPTSTISAESAPLWVDEVATERAAEIAQQLEKMSADQEAALRAALKAAKAGAGAAGDAAVAEEVEAEEAEAELEQAAAAPASSGKVPCVRKAGKLECPGG